MWLIFGAFMFALGYEKTGLGRRIALLLVRAMGRKTLTLGYAVMIADLLLAPFTPSNTARSGGTIYPVIRNLPPLYDSKPNDPSMRRMGSYLMWVAIAATCVTSSLFLTALAPNLLAIELVRKTANVELAWMDWFIAFAPVGDPAARCWSRCSPTGSIRPEVKEGSGGAGVGGQGARANGAAQPDAKSRSGFSSSSRWLLWIFGGDIMEATTAAIVVISLMLLLSVVTWDDITANKAAWNTLAWFATLVALADGLSQVGFIKWFADTVAGQLSGVSPTMAVSRCC